MVTVTHRDIAQALRDLGRQKRAQVSGLRAKQARAGPAITGGLAGAVIGGSYGAMASPRDRVRGALVGAGVGGGLGALGGHFLVKSLHGWEDDVAKAYADLAGGRANVNRGYAGAWRARAQARRAATEATRGTRTRPNTPHSDMSLEELAAKARADVAAESMARRTTPGALELEAGEIRAVQDLARKVRIQKMAPQGMPPNLKNR